MRDARRAWQLAYRQYRGESRHHISQPAYWMTRLDTLNLILSLSVR